MATRHGFHLLRGGMAGVDLVVADSARAFGRHVHEQFGIGLIERGAQTSASGRGTVEAGPGDLITVNPGEVHDGRPHDASGRRWRMVYVDPSLLLAAADDVEAGHRFEFTAPVLREKALAARFEAFFDAARGDDGLQRDAALLALVSTLLRPRHGGSPAVVAGVLAARERIDDDPAAAPTLAGLAAAAGLSRYQFLRAFTHLTGLPPHAYLLQRRMQRARRLVAAGLPLAEVAAAAGFADQSHMTRVFARHLGLTPGAFAAARR